VEVDANLLFACRRKIYKELVENHAEASIESTKEYRTKREMCLVWEIAGSGRTGSTSLKQVWAMRIEAGIAPMFSSGRTEWDTDLLFKKPFTPSDKLEFMIGAGPAWTVS
jgi:hypothetical protein